MSNSVFSSVQIELLAIFDKLEKEVTRLQGLDSQASAMEQRLKGLRESHADFAKRADDLKSQITDIQMQRRTAETEAQSIKNDAAASARKIIGDAKRSADITLSKAHQEASRIVESANGDANDIRKSIEESKRQLDLLNKEIADANGVLARIKRAAAEFAAT